MPRAIPERRNPITGIAGCRARAGSGHAAADPAMPVTKLRRRTACLRLGSTAYPSRSAIMGHPRSDDPARPRDAQLIPFSNACGPRCSPHRRCGPGTRCKAGSSPGDVRPHSIGTMTRILASPQLLPGLLRLRARLASSSRSAPKTGPCRRPSSRGQNRPRPRWTHRSRDRNRRQERKGKACKGEERKGEERNKREQREEERRAKNGPRHVPSIRRRAGHEVAASDTAGRFQATGCQRGGAEIENHVEHRRGAGSACAMCRASRADHRRGHCGPGDPRRPVRNACSDRRKEHRHEHPCGHEPADNRELQDGGGTPYLA